MEAVAVERSIWIEGEGAVLRLVTTFLLEEEGGGARVTLRESDYEAIPVEERQQWLDQSGGGYTMSMENLKANLEGRILPYT